MDELDFILFFIEKICKKMLSNVVRRLPRILRFGVFLIIHTIEFAVNLAACKKDVNPNDSIDGCYNVDIVGRTQMGTFGWVCFVFVPAMTCGMACCKSRKTERKVIKFCYIVMTLSNVVTLGALGILHKQALFTFETQYLTIAFFTFVLNCIGGIHNICSFLGFVYMAEE